MSDGPNAPAINPLPPVVVAIAVAMVLVELAFYAGAQGYVGGPTAVGWRLEMISKYAVNGEVQRQILELGRWHYDLLVRYIAYPFIHGSWGHVAFVSVILLALGKFVGEVLQGWAVLMVFAASTVIGAMAYAATGAEIGLIGGYPAAFGMVGAYTYLRWVIHKYKGENPIQAFALIGMLLALRLVFGVMFGGNLGWVAEVAGFVTGFALTVLIAPGGWQRAIALLRQR